MRAVFSPTGRAWIELDSAALRRNVQVLQALCPQGCVLMPAVKANAYGHGAIPIARELNRAGVDAFCVAAAQEGAELRENGVRGDILVLGYTHPDQFPLLRQYELIQTIPDLPYAQALSAAGKQFKVHLKLDTGMHRLGLPWDALEEQEAVLRLPNLQVTGAYTHLCDDTADQPKNRAFTQAQGSRFWHAVSALRQRGYAIPSAHILSSYGLFRCPELGGCYARVGIALYGTLSTKADEALARSAGLRPVLSLKARVAHVLEVPCGEGAGYDLAFVARRDSRLAVLTIGYADGLPRSLACGVGSVLLHGQRAQIVGRICMDQTLVDVTDIPGVSPGDTAVLIGRDGDLELTACDLAEQGDTIANEVLSRLGGRLERVLV